MQIFSRQKCNLLSIRSANYFSTKYDMKPPQKPHKNTHITERSYCIVVISKANTKNLISDFTPNKQQRKNHI